MLLFAWGRRGEREEREKMNYLPPTAFLQSLLLITHSTPAQVPLSSGVHRVDVEKNPNCHAQPAAVIPTDSGQRLTAEVSSVS